MPALGLKLRLNRITARILSVLTTNLQMWHKFTASPWTGANRLPDSSPVGTNTGALFTGRALDFDGVNDWVDCGNPNITCRSLVLYINPDVTTDEIMRLTSAINVSIVSGTLTATGWTSPTLYVNGVAGTSVSAGAWHQIAITSATGFTVNDLELGRTSATAWYAGLIANVKIFSVELTAAQVAELYANPERPVPTGVTDGQLVGWWLMHENSNKVVADYKNNQGGIISGAVLVNSIEQVVYQNSLLGETQTQYFNNTGNLKITDAAVRPASWTYYVHFYADDYLTSNNTGLANTLNGFSLNNGWALAFYGANLNIITGNGTGNVNAPIGSLTQNLKVGVAYKFLCTYDGTTLSVYRDNVLSGTSARTIVYTGTSYINISSFYDGALYSLRGGIFTVGYWNRVLTSDERNSLHQNDKPELITSGIIGAWYPPKGLNDNWTDASGNGRTAIKSGTFTQKLDFRGFASTTITGQPYQEPNTGALLISNDGYASVADAASLDITNAITLEAWVKPFTVATLQTIIGKNSAYALNITSGAKLQFQRWSGTTSGTVASSASLVANAWRHVAITYNGTTTLIYINGVLDTTSTAISGAIDTTSTAVLLGALTTTTQQFSGYIDNVRIYSAVLTAAQIAGNYKAEKGGYN